MTIMLLTFDEPLGIPEAEWAAYAQQRQQWMLALLSYRH